MNGRPTPRPRPEPPEVPPAIGEYVWRDLTAIRTCDERLVVDTLRTLLQIALPPGTTPDRVALISVALEELAGELTRRAIDEAIAGITSGRLVERMDA